MQCPQCQDPLIIVESDGVELDLCAAGHGTWFDAQEVQLLFLRAGMEERLASFTARLASLPSESKGRKCPRCRAQMEHAGLADTAGPILDRCPYGDGLWFDAGELQALLTAVGEGAEEFAPLAAQLESFAGAMTEEVAS